MLKVNNKIIKINNKWLNGVTSPEPPEPPEPSLPPYTLRLKYKEGVTPTFTKGTGVQVSTNPNIWDLTYEDTNWTDILVGHTDLLEVLGGNTTGIVYLLYAFHDCTSLTSVALFDTSGVTDMHKMFQGCSSLTTLPLFDTSRVNDMEQMFARCTSLTTVPLFDTHVVTNMDTMFASCTSLTSVPLFNTQYVTNMNAMFRYCSSLTSIPLFNTRNVDNMEYMFNGCVNVQSGALALYQQASTQAHTPTYHSQCFHDCGTNTTTGAAELAQIPLGWK